MARDGKPPWFKFYAGDFLSDGRVSAMTLEERGAYITLLAHAWIDGSIPSDPAEVARLLHVDGSGMGDLWQRLRVCFSEEPSEGRLSNPRMEEEREKWRDVHEKRREEGRKAALKRWGSHSPPNGLPNGSPMPSQKSEVRSQKKRKKKGRKRPPSGPHQEIVDHWCDGWKETRLGEVWKVMPKDLAAFKKLRELADGDVEEVKTRINRVLNDDDAWVAKNASPSYLVSRWNNYSVVVKKDKPKTYAQQRLEEMQNGQ